MEAQESCGRTWQPGFSLMGKGEIFFSCMDIGMISGKLGSEWCDQYLRIQRETYLQKPEWLISQDSLQPKALLS